MSDGSVIIEQCSLVQPPPPGKGQHISLSHQPRENPVGSIGVILASSSRPHGHKNALLSTGAISTSASGSSDPDLTQRVDSHSQATTSTSTDTAATPPAHSKAIATASDTKDLQAALQQMMISRRQAAAAGPSTIEDQAQFGSSASPSSKTLWGANLTQRFKASIARLAGGLTLIKHLCQHDYTATMVLE